MITSVVHCNRCSYSIRTVECLFDAMAQLLLRSLMPRLLMLLYSILLEKLVPNCKNMNDAEVTEVLLWMKYIMNVHDSDSVMSKEGCWIYFCLCCCTIEVELHNLNRTSLRCAVLIVLTWISIKCFHEKEFVSSSRKLKVQSTMIDSCIKQIYCNLKCTVIEAADKKPDCESQCLLCGHSFLCSFYIARNFEPKQAEQIATSNIHSFMSKLLSRGIPDERHILAFSGPQKKASYKTRAWSKSYVIQEHTGPLLLYEVVLLTIILSGMIKHSFTLPKFHLVLRHKERKKF